MNRVDLTQYGIRQRYAEIKLLAERIGKRCQQEIEELGFSSESVCLKTPAEARYSLERDPASGDYTLVGNWIDPHGYRQGTLVFHADGSFFVEQNVVQPHPKKKRWFVEAVNAWGKGEDIKAEARLLPMPE